MFKRIAKQLGRITHELLISGLLLWCYLSEAYQLLAPTLQVIVLKATLVSLGFLHAHMTRKLAFPSVDWKDEEDVSLKLLCTCLYIVFIYAYSHGG